MAAADMAGADVAAADMAGADVAGTVEEAIRSRRSVRAFLPDPVPEEVVRNILDASARAPSGTNIQPWKVHVVAGEARTRVSAAVLAAREEDPKGGGRRYDYYPAKWREPYLSRRRKVGLDLYGLLGLGREDRAGMWAQFGRNYSFFDAPVGLFFCMDADMATGAWLDLGMFLENVMLMARAHGLHSCPQAAWMEYPDAVAGILDLADDEILVCGLSLGFEDTAKVENSLRTEREPVDAFARFHGF